MIASRSTEIRIVYLQVVVYSVTLTLACSVSLLLPLGVKCDDNFATLQKEKLEATFVEVICILYIDTKNLMLIGYRKKTVTKKDK
jgi:hypothetical protein